MTSTNGDATQHGGDRSSAGKFLTIWNVSSGSRRRAPALTLALGVYARADDLRLSPSNQQKEARPPVLFLPEVLDPYNRFTLPPGFSADGRTMFFSQTECLPIWQCPQRLKRIDKTSSGWTAPRLVPLPQDARGEAPSVTPDGRYLLFSWAATRPEHPEVAVNDNFDLWRLDLTVPGAAPEPLRGPDLNRPRAGRVKTLRYVHNETAPSLTTEGDLYFWTERLDGVGERDVYVARATSDGGFAKPEPLPAPINSEGWDDGAWVSADGKLMLITYSNRGGCGGNDLFLSRRIAGRWTEPKNLGCEVNSAYDDGAGMIIPGSRTLVFMSGRPFPGGQSGAVALWTVEVEVE
ncbi:MAG: hypothetical protein ACKVS7_07640 [Gemmatimonadaceae bacterium]